MHVCVVKAKEDTINMKVKGGLRKKKQSKSELSYLAILVRKLQYTISYLILPCWLLCVAKKGC